MKQAPGNSNILNNNLQGGKLTASQSEEMTEELMYRIGKKKK